MGGVRPNVSENGQIRPSATVRPAQLPVLRSQLASGLQEGRKMCRLTAVRESSGESRFIRAQTRRAGKPAPATIANVGFSGV